jgi:hypothetical protein
MRGFISGHDVKEAGIEMGGRCQVRGKRVRPSLVAARKLPQAVTEHWIEGSE